MEDARAIHQRQISLRGGLAGAKDEGLVESALAAPVNLWTYEAADDVLMLSIKLCMAIARNHGYLDGNKRTGTAAMLECLALNGYWLSVPDTNETHPLLGILVEECLVREIDEGQLYDLLDPYLLEITQAS